MHKDIERHKNIQKSKCEHQVTRACKNLWVLTPLFRKSSAYSGRPKQNKKVLVSQGVAKFVKREASNPPRWTDPYCGSATLFISLEPVCVPGAVVVFETAQDHNCTVIPRGGRKQYRRAVQEHNWAVLCPGWWQCRGLQALATSLAFSPPKSAHGSDTPVTPS